MYSPGDSRLVIVVRAGFCSTSDNGNSPRLALFRVASGRPRFRIPPPAVPGPGSRRKLGMLRAYGEVCERARILRPVSWAPQPQRISFAAYVVAYVVAGVVTDE